MKILSIKRNFNTNVSEVTVRSNLRLTPGTYMQMTTTVRIDALFFDSAQSAPRNKDSSILCVGIKVATHTHRTCLFSDIDNHLVVIPNFNEILQKLYAHRVDLDSEAAFIESISGRTIRGQARLNHGENAEYVPFRVALRNATLVLA